MSYEKDHELMETPIEKKGYSMKKTVLVAASPLVLLTPLLFRDAPTTYTTTTIPVTAPLTAPLQPVPSPFNPESITMLQSPVVAQPAGFATDTSLEILANILDPLITLMVAVSFPIASVIMVGSCFFFMFGNNERAWDGIFKAAMGYVLIQMSPLFLEILRQVGEAV